jgi:hypothetical protein
MEKMKKKCCLLVLLVMLLSIQSAFAAIWDWKGGALDNDWSNLNNWNPASTGVPVAGDDVRTGFWPDYAYEDRPIVDETTPLLFSVWMANYNFDSEIDVISGGHLNVEHLFAGSNGKVGTLDISGNGLVTATSKCVLGNESELVNSTGVVNIRDNAKLVTPYFAMCWGNVAGVAGTGIVNLFGGELEVSDMVLGKWGAGYESTVDTALIDLKGGLVRWKNADAGDLAFLQGLVDDDIAVAYGDTGTVEFGFEGTDIVMYGTPEPATVCLLGLGALIATRRKRS